ncbi:MAG: hypothetical protein ACU0DW_15290, partial [Shimia sp.]
VQSGVKRWGDFIPFAHTAGCTYTLGIADMAGPGDTLSNRGPLRSVELSQYGLETLMSALR